MQEQGTRFGAGTPPPTTAGSKGQCPVTPPAEAYRPSPSVAVRGAPARTGAGCITAQAFTGVTSTKDPCRRSTMPFLTTVTISTANLRAAANVSTASGRVHHQHGCHCGHLVDHQQTSAAANWKPAKSLRWDRYHTMVAKPSARTGAREHHGQAIYFTPRPWP